MPDSKYWLVWVRLFFILIIITSISDVMIDLSQGANTLHMVQESMMAFFALALLVMLFLHTRWQLRLNRQLKEELAEATARSAEASEQLVGARRAFGEQIARQFQNWGLTDSEAEVALFTLKGLTAKEIAQLRNASEKTVRNQLTSVYKKSGTTGNTGFIAWFMEDLW